MIKITDITKVYNKSFEMIAYLENAYDISYTKEINSIYYASFSMPADDPKNKYLDAFNLVEIFDGTERVELFRIVNSTLNRDTKADIKYELEHVVCTLVDDVLFLYHQIGNLGVYTQEVINYILDKQEVKNWVLGGNDFARQFEYSWENENLLSALFSVPNPWSDYIWQYDTTVYPWKIYLKNIDTEVKSYIIYGKNMINITKTVDCTSIITKLYCLGYGEGDNQLNIKSVNNDLPYITSNNIATYGIKTGILVDRRYKNPENLLEYGKTILNEKSNPYVSYEVNTIDLHKIDRIVYEKFEVGDMVQILDKEDDIQIALPIIKIEKNNIIGGEISITVGNTAQDIVGSINEIQDKNRINELYSQGATNQFYITESDNCDADYPLVLKVYIPDTLERINISKLFWEVENFRGYTSGNASGGGTNATSSSGGGTTRSTTAGGNTTRSTSAGGSNTATSSSGGGGSTTSSSGGSETVTSESDYTKTITSSSGGSATETIVGNDEFQGYAEQVNDFIMGGPTNSAVVAHGHYFNTKHKHEINIPGHKHKIVIPGHTHDVSISNHTHRITLNNHSHNISIPSHNHSVDIPSHTHNVTLSNHTHTVDIPSHTHEIQYGIYEGSKADSVVIKVDDTQIPTANAVQGVDLVDYFAKDDEGKIKRNYLHVIEFYPDKLTRISAEVFMQIFTNSQGGGDY